MLKRKERKKTCEKIKCLHESSESYLVVLKVILDFSSCRKAFPSLFIDRALNFIKKYTLSVRREKIGKGRYFLKF